MIISKIIGGLGNQLFQYAMGRQLAERNKSDLLLDVNAYSNGYELRNFSLSHFNHSASIADQSQLNAFYHLKNPLKRILRKLKSIYKKQEIIIEQGHTFDKNKLALRGDIYLDGFWQTEKYFNDIRNILLDEFQIVTPPNKANARILDQLSHENNTVSIHVRRGDYVTNKDANNVHGLCSLDYYYRAIAHLNSSCNDCCFYVFSDDISWVKENLKIEQKVVWIDFNSADEDYEDLRLMTHCKHNIIANSTFSWWGAWLNKNPNKIVVAPQKWFLSNNIDGKDVIPTSWVTL